MTSTLKPVIPESSGAWMPLVGRRTRAFIAKKTSGPAALSGPSMEVVLSEASDILSQCVDPSTESGSTAVLAVGYVQSGKTLSFTTVTSLARDNGYGIVVVLAGTTNNLKGQSEDRLVEDLGLEDLQRDWRHFNNPDLSGSHFDDLRQTLSSWDRRRQGLATEDKPAVLVTLLKHASRIGNAAKLFRDLRLVGVPVLIIDDESDQAGLNTKARKNLLTGSVDESGTYESIVELRKSLPHHSYLQYTATPQANLLLAATDVLDPSFAKVISSGDGYTGGQVFFQKRSADLIVQVPNSEIFDPKAPFPEPPAMLQQALQVFLLGIAAGAGSDAPANRSMMVQAHQNTAPHSLYNKWIRSLMATWGRGIESGTSEELAEIESEFAGAYKELSKTVEPLESLTSLLGTVGEKIADVRVVIVNSKRDAERQIRWKTWEYWILIGGQKLDRGFTVEGLTVTYMPRPVSANADVLQQRARFFGYRSSYIDFCRVYLLRSSIDAFSGYVDDEEYLRRSLRLHEGKPLKAWRRDFILHEALSRPTRANVVGRSQKKLPLSKGWIWPKSMHLDGLAVQQNIRTFEALRAEFVGELQDAATVFDAVDNRGDSLRNLVKESVPLSRLEGFLLDLRFPGREDSLLTTALEMALARTLKNDPNATFDLVLISEMKTPKGSGRSLDVLRENIFVGMSPQGASGANVVYSGDRAVLNQNSITVQLRLVSIRSPMPPAGESYAQVPWFAIHLPANVANHAWLEND